MSPSTACAPARSFVEPFATRQGSLEDSNPIAAKLRADGSACFRVFGASMFPWIRSGDLVFVRRFAREQAAPGDVIAFERDGRLFVHRVVRGAVSPSSVRGRTSSGLITKGDALDREDAPVSREEFLGRVIRIHRGKRHIDMESLGRVLLGRLLARISWASFLLYLPARTAKHLLLG